MPDLRLCRVFSPSSAVSSRDVSLYVVARRGQTGWLGGGVSYVVVCLLIGLLIVSAYCFCLIFGNFLKGVSNKLVRLNQVDKKRKADGKPLPTATRAAPPPPRPVLTEAELKREA